MLVIDTEREQLRKKKVVTKCDYTPGEFLLPVFTRPERDGSNCMILNLKNLNKIITYHHFKMDTLLTTLKLVTPNCYMMSTDLKDTY